ncbi:MAG: hypothetical protein EOS25_13325 [Mesorhizobium sp.]|uniref:hypothetical protein n=1 Tax=Mesorhizobium sp. TaxID=1871066 RepID=UPI000FE9D036|nr:hypothetical protein [Mesorhizobium sp.]RWD45168.1 MAG: hypothetical protein EOS59_22060 [Mesorhizobium sp.]RWE52720.1 MAG: hypothetical protein EOS24_29175 [Mesorhizobium sp.]RWF07406.1 MAG: hypothetical protein EOS69_28835 [Mesorhizobium sp.]RWF18641.1 MAG: hypothetical protein EOS25_13325 [Mesorhizobium sp.]
MSSSDTLRDERPISVFDWANAIQSQTMSGEVASNATNSSAFAKTILKGPSEIRNAFSGSVSADAAKNFRWRTVRVTLPNQSAEPFATVGHNSGFPENSKLDRKVISYLSLSNDWDGDGAAAIPVDAIYRALNYLGEIRNLYGASEPTGAAPSPDGEVMLFWKNDDAYAELNFDKDGRCTLCYSTKPSDIETIDDAGEDKNAISDGNVFKTLLGYIEDNFPSAAKKKVFFSLRSEK